MKKPLILALVLALPAEVVSFLLAPFPAGVEFPLDVDGFVRMMGLRWTAMHLIGVQLGRWMDFDDAWAGRMIEFGAYLEFAILFFILFLALDLIRRRAQEVPPARKLEK